MRYKEFKLDESQLLEINMSPGNLAKLAGAINARAGLEFEMIVPDAENSNYDDYESEPDYDSDESVNDIDDAVRFFHDGDFNSRSDVDRLRRAMMSDYEDWYIDRLGALWDTDGEDYLRGYIRENASSDEWEQEGEDEEAAFEEFVNEQWKNQGSYYDDAREEFEQEHGDDFGQSEWLEDNNLNSMMDVESNYNIQWPHWTNVDNGNGGRSINDIATSFDHYLNRGVKTGGYHGVDRNTSAYIVEPDGSLDPDDSSDSGLEFVSPPLTISEMLDDLKRVSEWAKAEGCYTNRSTGLHMNVSVAGFDLNQLDYTKLAVLSGDQYVLEQFGRMGNTYTASALTKVIDAIRHNPNQAGALLDKMKGHLDQGASQLIHANRTSKYTSINLKDNRVEFRSPGGDWLAMYQADPGTLVNTLLRFVVALDAAMDPEKYRKEYLVKLYKLLSPEGNDTVKAFVEYAAGKQSKSELINFVRMAQQKRQAGKTWYWYRVSLPGYQDAEVVAQNEEGAWKKAAAEWKVPVQDILLPDLDVVNIGKYGGNTEPNKSQSAAQQADAQAQRHYEVFDREDPEQNTIEVIHGTDQQCADMLGNISQRRNVPRTRLGVRPVGHTATGANAGAEQPQQPQQPRQATAPNGVPLWEVYERDSGHVVYTFADHNPQSAWSTAQAWLRTYAEPAAASGFSCRPKMETN